MTDVTPHLRAISEGHPEALGTLADWCLENSRADEARRLRRYQLQLAEKLAELARERWPSSHADRHIRWMVHYVRKMFRREWEATIIKDLPLNLRRIYGGGEQST